MGSQVRRISVYLADRRVIFREGMHFILSNEEDIEITGESTSNNEALSFIESHLPDVAILNINEGMPSGIQITRRIVQHLPSVAAILIMDIEDEDCLFSAMKSGASACITRDIDSDKLLNLVRDAGKGGKPIIKDLCRPALATRVLAEFEALPVDIEVKDMLGQLTVAEADILHGISSGRPSEPVAAGLGLSEEALALHLTTVLSKLVANDQRRELMKTMQHLLQQVPQNRLEKLSAGYVTRDEFNEFKRGLEKRLGELYASKIAQPRGWVARVTSALRQAALKEKPSLRPERKAAGFKEIPPQEKARPALARGEEAAEAVAPARLRTKKKTRNTNQNETDRSLNGFHLKPELSLIHFLKGLGYEIEESARITGVSGAVHTVDILATRDDRVVKHLVAIGVFRARPGEAEVGTEELCNFELMTDDIGVHNKIVVAIPKLSPEARKVAEAQQIRVLGVDDLMFLPSPDLVKQPQL